jgi:ubiquinone/menaquinone biosynthesis C-methylase UbiE
MATDFDERAATWDDDPAKVQRADVVADAIGAAVPLTPATRLLEYGAGTGLTSQALADDVGAITLAEPSEGMRIVAAEKVASGALPADTRIWDLDLATMPVPDETFDVIVTVMTLHHIHELERVLMGFARLLDHGGHLCVVDLEAEDGSFHDADSGFDGHHGFDREELEAWLHAEGFTDVRFETVHEIERENGTYPLFLATARRG